MNFNQKIIHALGPLNPQLLLKTVNKVPFKIHAPITGLEPVKTLDGPYFSESFQTIRGDMVHGEKNGSPNTKLALQWYKQMVSPEQYENSEYLARVNERITGSQYIVGDWHNHDTGKDKKIFTISSIDPTLVLNIPSLALPFKTGSAINHFHTFPCISELIQKGIITKENIIQPKPFEILEIHESFIHISPTFNLEVENLEEKYRWFIFIRQF
jgi:hypothetical protein